MEGKFSLLEMCNDSHKMLRSLPLAWGAEATGEKDSEIEDPLLAE